MFFSSSTSISTLPGDRLHVDGVVVEVVPARRVVQPAHHVDAVGRHDVVAVVQIVLFGRKHHHLRPRLLPRIGLAAGSLVRLKADTTGD